LTGLTTGAITGAIDRLVQAGFVQRERTDRDRRKVLVLPNWEKIEQEIIPLYRSLLRTHHKLCEHYTDAELATILDFHQRTEAILRSEIEQLRNVRGLSADR
jgi:DNA-binding MarR family transcriptional regulator